MDRFARFLYQPLLPLGRGGKMLTGSRAHRELARKVAEEGTVLLKNDGTLPLKKSAKICLFGTGAGVFLFGGGGSGNVYSTENLTLAEALRAAAKRGEIDFFEPLSDFYVEAMKEQRIPKPQVPTKYGYCPQPQELTLPALPEKLYKEAAKFGNTAIYCLSRYSAEGDLNGDRSGGAGDFDLTAAEKKLLKRLTADFARVVVIVNACGPVSVREYKNDEKIGALVYALYGGCMAGEALVNILLGKSEPGGRLQDTLANRLSDYPSTAEFGKHESYENYTEDIYVGYRYFETLAPEKTAYPFGFGLSYTTFRMTCREAEFVSGRVKLTVEVKNLGKRPGRAVPEVYLSAPQGKLGKPAKVLAAFEKTQRLLPGETETLILSFRLADFASFDDLGKIRKCAFVLEAGEYRVLLGENVRDAKVCHTFCLEKDRIVKVCKPYMAPKDLKERLTADGTMEKLPRGRKCPAEAIPYRLAKPAPEKLLTLEKAFREDRLDEFLASLCTEDLAELLYGHPMMNASSTNGIGLKPRNARFDDRNVPLVPTSDGPAGLRLRRGLPVPVTFFPCANVLAQTWDLALARKVGRTIATEVLENNIGIWLAPGMNIHRSPLCGRNFEYYSEDPLSAGRFAASVVRGVQSMHIAATVKHFLCNNRESTRRIADSRVSMRALREIYLRGFEIAVKEGRPWALMTSYNPVNGRQSTTNDEAINGILRGEWGYDGVVMTDWRTFSNLPDEVRAGSDVKMPVAITTFYEKTPKHFDLAKEIESGRLDRGLALAAARRILLLMGHLD